MTFTQTTSQSEYYFNSVGSNASSGEYIYFIDLVLNTVTLKTSSFYNKSNNANDYYFEDIFDWVWPRSNPDLINWSFPLPNFMLSSSYIIHIGN